MSEKNSNVVEHRNHGYLIVLVLYILLAIIFTRSDSY